MNMALYDDSSRLQFDDCNYMEEDNLKGSKYVCSRELLSLIGTQQVRYGSKHGSTLTKMNQSFTPLLRRSSQNRLKTNQNRELNALHYLIKHKNKIQTNILLHKNTQSRSMHQKQFGNNKKDDLICNTPHYNHYFTPKVRKQIIFKHKSIIQKQNFARKRQHKSSVISLHVDDEDQSYEKHQIQLQKKTFKKTKQSHKLKEQLKKTGANTPKQCFGSFSQMHGMLGKVVNKEITEYNRQQLQSYYQSLIKYSKGDHRKYKDGFETMLNLMEVSTNDKILAQWFNHFQSNPTFQQFTRAFTNIVDAVLRESVMDFFDIVFQDCGVRDMGKEELIDLLSQRMKRGEAQDIVEEIFFIVAPDYNKPISTATILALCCTNDQFCWFMRQFKILQHRKK